MAACDSLQHMFDAPLTSEPSLSSWNPQLGLPSPPLPRSSSVTELFGELHFEESPIPNAMAMPASSSNVKNMDIFDTKSDENERKVERKDGGYGGPWHRSTGSLQLCTEGLGFESLGDVKDTNEEDRIGTTSGDDGKVGHKRVNGDDGDGGYYCFWGARKMGNGLMLRRWRSTMVTRRERVGGAGSCFPPPISIVNRPWVSLRGYRCDGRFMLKEVTVPAREFLHASREGGRLRLNFVQGGQEEDDEEDEVDDDESNVDDDDDNEEVVEEESDAGKMSQ